MMWLLMALIVRPETEYQITLTPHSMVEEVPGWIFDDREPQIATLTDVAEEITTDDSKMAGFVPEPPQSMGEYELTAYIETGSPCADGVYPRVGYTAACNDKRLWHKWVHIEGHGDYYIHDTGGMANNVIDIYMGSYEEAIRFGRQTANVYVIGE